MCEIQLRNRLGEVIALALVDECDGYLADRKWYLLASGTGYAATNEHGRCVLMHRLITDAPAGLEVDHRNGDTLDNRRENLRLVTHAENLQNIARKGQRYRGIHRLPYGGWRVQVRRGGVVVFDRVFASEIEAAKAAKAERAKHMTHAEETRHPINEEVSHLSIL